MDENSFTPIVNTPPIDTLQTVLPPSGEKPKDSVSSIIIAVIVILMGILAVMGYNEWNSRQQIVATPTPIPTLTPTPTPIRRHSQLATQSAFLSLDSNVASLSTAINDYSVQAPSLSPPVLTLPLGFSQ